MHRDERAPGRSAQTRKGRSSAEEREKRNNRSFVFHARGYCVLRSGKIDRHNH